MNDDYEYFDDDENETFDDVGNDEADTFEQPITESRTGQRSMMDLLRQIREEPNQSRKQQLLDEYAKDYPVDNALRHWLGIKRY